MKSKIKIQPKSNLEEKIEIELKENKILLLEKKKFLKLKESIPEDVEYAEVSLPGGTSYYAIIKQELRDALFDPSSNDLDILRKARDALRGTIRKSGGKLMIKESPIERSIDDRYINSLIMNIIKYPEDRPFTKNLKQLGLYNKDIRKLYEQGLAAWLGTDASLDLEGFGNNIEKVGYTGVDSIVDLKTELCGEGSHYKLNVKARKIQKTVSKEAVKINEEYIKIENKIVEWIMANTKNNLIKNNAKNLVRMTLNLFCLYDGGKPFPIE